MALRGAFRITLVGRRERDDTSPFDSAQKRSRRRAKHPLGGSMQRQHHPLVVRSP